MTWDVLVVGGGITGAAVFREATRHGLRTLLVERGDFASGTSSRSSKLVHGGLHYLSRLRLGLAVESMRERNRLLAERPGLVRPLPFTFLPGRSRGAPGRFRTEALLGAYRVFAGEPLLGSAGEESPLPPGTLPHLRLEGSRYRDAQTDDARLVVRELLDGVSRGGTAMNYVRASDPGFNPGRGEFAVRLLDLCTGASSTVHGRVLVNATGAWVDRLDRGASSPVRVRRVRGSHLVLPSSRLPLRHAVAALRPGTREPVFFLPWKGVILVGTTSVDLEDEHVDEPRISPEEALLLLADVNRVFPGARITPRDVQATFAGVRPIVDDATRDPALASREEAIVDREGWITVTGGKLTTHRATALRVLRRCAPRIPGLRPDPRPGPTPASHSANGMDGGHLDASYGPGARAWILKHPADRRGEAELQWIGAHEGVRHLDDLLLRRLRWGITRPAGGLERLERLRDALEPVLGWDELRWATELERYRRLLDRSWRLPPELRPAAPAEHPGRLQ